MVGIPNLSNVIAFCFLRLAVSDESGLERRHRAR